METAILGGIIKELITSLGGFAYNRIARVLGIKDEIEKLAESLRSITLALRDADLTIAHSEATDEQLKKLTEITYEAESIVDRFKIEMSMLRTSLLAEWNGSSVCRCCREVNTRYHAAKRVENLNKRLEDLRASRDLSQVLQALALGYQSVSNSSNIGPCHDEPDLIGSVISNDCDDHIRRLQRQSGGAHSLFAIVGAPGVGKTALARKIYNAMRDEFATRLWVNISSGMGSMAIWSGEEMDMEASSAGAEQQKEIICSHLRGSNLLLVIDNVRDKDGWEFLGELGEGFLCRGVRVVLTATHRDVTRMIGVDRWSCCHHVRALDEDDGWLLLLRTAQLREREAVANFQVAGKRIVRKCSGLPLALKAVGSKLRHQDQVGKWNSELSTDFIVMYKEIRRSIDASYMELGYRLKRCFLYCSMYPEGSVIEQHNIVQQWIAEGFFEGTPDPEEEARECYVDLVNRSLLLPTTDGAEGCATMPTLLRSYAIYRSQDENCVDGDAHHIGRVFKVWRFCTTDADTIRDIPNDVASLRTLLVFGSSSTQQVYNNGSDAIPPLMNVICRRFTSLRVLDLRDTEVEAVSSTLGRLLQLRYLNLSKTRIKTLPREVRNLVMLQFLILKSCPHLTSLPASVGRLRNLRSLEISGTPELHDIQFRLSNLRELNCLRGFLPVNSASRRCSHGWTFLELSNLSKLTSLQILNLRSGISSQEAAQLRLQEKDQLKELELCCTPVAQPAAGDSEILGGLVTALEPPQHLTSLKLANFYGSEIPSWVSSEHLTLLQRLTLDSCTQCQRLPPLGEMSHLTYLEVRGCNALSGISDELRGAPVNWVAFPRLEQLIVGEMPSLQTWTGLEACDMPLLRRFQLFECPKLLALPAWPNHCMALTSLKVQKADALLEIGELPALEELQVSSCGALRRIANLCRLEDMDVVECSALNAVEAVPLLRCLRLKEHGMHLPQWLQEGQKLQPLRRLEIVGCEGLLDKCSSDLAPYGPAIKDAGDLVYAKLHNGSIYFSYTKSSTRRFHRSARCMERADIYGAALESRALHEGDHGDRKAWMWRAVYGFVTALFFLMGSAVTHWTRI